MVDAIQGTLKSETTRDAFVCKLSPNGTRLVWSTYLGGKYDSRFPEAYGGDEALGITLDSAGAVYVTGETGSVDFPVLNGYQKTLKRIPGYLATDAFVAKLVEPLPSVKISRSGNSVSIAWPVSAAGFVLEVTDALAAPTSWAAEPTTPSVVGDQNVVTLEIGIEQKFFRLRKR